MHNLDNWYTINSSDYYVSICPVANGYSSPENIAGYCIPKNGNAYVATILFQAAGNLKEYFYQQLQTPLVAGKKYCLSFWVNRADGITHAIHSIGAYFSSALPSMSGTNEYINVIPQVVNQNGFITDTLNWTNIQGCYTAVGGEQYVLFGNFNSNASTDTLFVGSANPTANADRYAYYYFDDISLIENTSVGIVEQSNKSEVFSLWPNPANDVLNIEFSHTEISSAPQTHYNIIITDVVGREVLQQQYNKAIDVSLLQEGIYFLSVYKNNTLLQTKKFIKE